MVISLVQAHTALIVVPKRQHTTQVNKQDSTSPKHTKCKDIFLFCSKLPTNMISVLGNQTKHSRFREEQKERGAYAHRSICLH